MSELLFGEGVTERLGAVLSAWPDPILVVTGVDSYQASGADRVVENALSTRQWRRHQVEERLPGATSVARALADVGGDQPAVIVAVGGGAVLDTAKALGLCIANPGLTPTETSSSTSDAVALVAIPTTSGSGSERTPFAVYYDGATKYSVEHESLLPRVALVDPTLTYSTSPAVTAAAGLDVLCHAIESTWAAAASPDSRRRSLAALDDAWSALAAVVHRPDPDSRRVMARASTEAGAAIAVSRTTAPHALSYHLTVHHHVAHGHAAALTLGAMLEFNSGVDETNCAPGVDLAEVKRSIERICDSIGANDAGEARRLIEVKVEEVGLPSRLSELGVDRGGIEAMADSVNQQRLANNPRHLEREQIVAILEELR